MGVLEMLIIVAMPSSGVYACSSHMAEKSPSVQPMRQRKVLTPALIHVWLDVQKSRDRAEVVVEALRH